MYKKKELKITMPPLKEGYVTVTVTVWAEIMNFLRLANYHQDMLCKCTIVHKEISAVLGGHKTNVSTVYLLRS